MPVCPHGKRATIGMAQPPGDSRNVNAGLDTASCEQVPQVMVSDVRYSEFGASVRQSHRAFGESQYTPSGLAFCDYRISRIRTQPIKQLSHWRNDRDWPALTALGAGYWISVNPD